MHQPTSAHKPKPAATKPHAAPAATPHAPPAAKPATAPGYAAQHRAAAPKSPVVQAQGATLQNNQVLPELGKPGAKTQTPAAQRPPGQFTCLGQTMGSLQAVHDWLDATKPQDAEVVIQVTPGSLVSEMAQTTWYYYNPKQKIVLDGAGAEASGFDGKRPTPGFFLSYRPEVGTGTAADRPAAANLEVKNLSIRGYESGGIEISPQTVRGKQDEWAGGLSAFVGDASVHDVNFKDLGRKGTALKVRVWNNLRFGAGGILMRGVENSTFENNHFENLVNGTTTYNGTDTKGNPTSREGEANHLFHGIYARDGSSGNHMRGNTFDNVGGDVMRVSNASNNNVIEGNTTRNSGTHGLVSNWFNSAKDKPEVDSTGTIIRNNKIGKTFGGKKQGKAYDRHESKGKQGQVSV